MKFSEGIKLAQDPLSGCVVIRDHVQHMWLPPRYLNGRIRSGVKELLERQIGKYNESFDGIHLAYSKVKVIQRASFLLYDSVDMHFDVHYDVVIFRVYPGTLLKCTVNKVSADHLGCLIHKVINMSVPVPAWTFDHNQLKGQEMICKVTKVEYKKGVLGIYGELTEESFTSIQEGFASYEEIRHEEDEMDISQNNNTIEQSAEMKGKKGKKRKKKASKDIEHQEESFSNNSQNQNDSLFTSSLSVDETSDSQNLDSQISDRDCSNMKVKKKKKHKRKDVDEIRSDEEAETVNLLDQDLLVKDEKRKKKKHKEKKKKEENENTTQTGMNASAFTDSSSLINAVQNKYSKESGHPHSTSAGNKGEEIAKVIEDRLEGNELQSVRGRKGESSVISSGGESMEDATKSFTDRMAEFGQKFVNKSKLSDGGRNNKENTGKQKRQALPEKQPIGTDESKNEKTKMDILNKDTAEISNQKRLQAIKDRQEDVKNKQKAIQAALARVDERKQPGAKQHVRFDSESEEGPEDAEEVEEKKKDTSKEPSLALFADENNDESGSDEDWFQVKPQFEGEKGLELLKLQRKFGDDERFRLDERFAEEDEGEEGDDADEDKYKEDGDEGDLETEKTKALSILENVLGNMLPARKSTEDKKTKFRDMGQVRFDPSREDHEKFLLPQQEVSETNAKPKKKRKKKKQAEEEKGIVEAPLPEVSKEVFFDVKSDLTSALNQSEQVTFGFFNDNEDEEETQENKEEEYFLPSADFVWTKKKLPYDSSESEGEAEETTKQEALSVENPNEMEHRSSKSFFFGRNDHRLKDGASQFCRPKDLHLKDNWEEKRTQLWAATYKRHQKALRDNKQNRKQRRTFKHP